MMLKYSDTPLSEINESGKQIVVFKISGQNLDSTTVESFGKEWLKFSSFTDKEIKTAGDQYFDIVPDELYNGKLVLDAGCGTGRWSKYLSSKAGFIEAIDPSDAVFSAGRLLAGCQNVRISKAEISHLPFDDNSFDFVFSLGVLHHIPDTKLAMNDCVKKLKKGGWFLVYLYYNLDNRNIFFKGLFYFSNLLRRMISGLPSAAKKLICDLLAIIIYMPLVLLARIFNSIGLKKLVSHIPLSYYADKSFKIIRNDSLDRFGTPLEQRFSRKQIKEMMEYCGLSAICFSEKEPYWHAIGNKV